MSYDCYTILGSGEQGSWCGDMGARMEGLDVLFTRGCSSIGTLAR